MLEGLLTSEHFYFPEAGGLDSFWISGYNACQDCICAVLCTQWRM